MEPACTETMWEAICSCDRSQDGSFLYAVRSTGIVCRPSCPSRKPLRENTLIFRELPEALAQGFRPCKRCRPDLGPDFDPRAEVAGEAERILRRRFGEPGILDLLPNLLGLTRLHLDRVFKSERGLTTSIFLTGLRIEKAREAFAENPQAATADVAFSVGFESLSSFYASFREFSGQSPRLYRASLLEPDNGTPEIAVDRVAAGSWTLTIAVRGAKLCKVAVDWKDWEAFASGLATRHDPSACALFTEQLNEYFAGRRKTFSLPMETRGTPFSLRVREALFAIPYGKTRSYGEIASAIGLPGGARAIGQANSRNPLPVVVPCHRVVGGDGRLVGYKGANTAFKKFLLELERENP
jgi:AraC family transcriptional regulator of adaptative response/methylated-DNA-[protein]-cysteine methyltransferase